ncbi:MAG: hypothetical protein KBC84_06520, partial [Proteobacteria bacterium]|nr:hypothetical protein [Pseudomonadota bacterium]
TNVDAVKDALLALPKKHLPLVIAMDNDKLQELTLKKAVNLDDAYIRGAAFEQINAIDSKVNQLKKHGIEVVYSNFRDIASLAEKKYWELKLSGKL